MLISVPTLDYIPQRIVSLVPSQTELLHDMGLEQETVGITKFCVHPEQWFRNKTRIGGTKSVNIERVKQLRPDLIIANKEENVKEQIEALSQIAPVYVSDIQNLGQALEMIRTVGQLTDKTKQAEAIEANIANAFAGLQKVTGDSHATRVLYLIWYRPWMSIGGDTFINDMLKRMGLENVFEKEGRYPELSEGMIRQSNAEIVYLSSEPFPFKEKHISAIKTLLPDARIRLVDGEMFSWYGSRLLQAPGYFKQLIELPGC